MNTPAQTLARTRVHAPMHACHTFNVRITPHNSLSASNVLFLVVAIGTISVLFQIGLVHAGAWPGAIFMCLDTLLLVWAIIVAQARLQRHEDVALDGAVLTIERVDRGATTLSEHMGCCGLVVERHEDPEFGLRKIGLRNGRLATEIARDLSPAERETLFDALIRALNSKGLAPRVECHALGLHPLHGTDSSYSAR